ncbi:MAG: GGDEF domain-containing protein, partial [Actinomycetota bacterium]
ANRLNVLYSHLSDQQRRLEEVNAELKVTARIDALTGLGNRLRLIEDLTTLISRSRRYGRGGCVGILDLDFFKNYNDLYGHVEGDRALKAVAEAIADQIRSSDGAYRFGGEEFVCIFDALSPEESYGVLERIRLTVQNLGVLHAGNPPFNVVTISSGVSTVNPGSSPDELLESADKALYRAKSAGRNRVETEASSEDLNSF